MRVNCLPEKRLLQLSDPDLLLVWIFNTLVYFSRAFLCFDLVTLWGNIFLADLEAGQLSPPLTLPNLAFCILRLCFLLPCGGIRKPLNLPATHDISYVLWCVRLYPLLKQGGIVLCAMPSERTGN